MAADGLGGGGETTKSMLKVGTYVTRIDQKQYLRPQQHQGWKSLENTDPMHDCACIFLFLPHWSNNCKRHFHFIYLQGLEKKQADL